MTENLPEPHAGQPPAGPDTKTGARLDGLSKWATLCANRHVSSVSVSIVFFALAFATACAAPGVDMDRTGLGQDAIGIQMGNMSSFPDQKSVNRLTQRWFEKHCNIRDRSEATKCAEQLGMTCPPTVATGSSDILCDYRGVERWRTLSYVGLPSIHSEPTSPWTTSIATVILTFTEEGGAKITVDRQ